MLINCVAYQEGKRLADVPVENIVDFLHLPECFVWVALKDAVPEELKQMQSVFQLHELAVEDALHGHQRPKIEEYGDSLFAVVHTVELADGELLWGELHIFVEEDYVLSVRNRSERSLLGVRARCEREPHLLRHGSAFVFYALMDAVVDRYFPVLEQLETELETVEEQIFTKGSERANIERLYQLKRKVTQLKHAVAPLMEAVTKLYGGRVPRICQNTEEYFRDVSDHLYRINTSIDNIRDTIATAIQVNLSMVTIEESEVNKRLAAWAAIFAVATAFFGIWGMNFEFMPELKWKYGYPVSIAVVAAVCSYLYRRFRKSGWL
ncbi:MAG TPA: magnesium and cobalt transport protein CorA [Noviherbaspirillum sp.]|uniref:magnesium and cobalt transport protein CorA n=1 Tax=Noviherbaspirillum sp. TaxID=1926288 RepID=UPI002D75CB0A|nr:magnesium and cobalt transport protein CorA [Noviherbaspirillum sp.]HYD96070.1 magnesium and cobalt transport protein CorA [Noviherbaspirillum sp.]